VYGILISHLCLQQYETAVTRTQCAIGIGTCILSVLYLHEAMFH